MKAPVALPLSLNYHGHYVQVSRWLNRHNLPSESLPDEVVPASSMRIAQWTEATIFTRKSPTRLLLELEKRQCAVDPTRGAMASRRSLSMRYPVVRITASTCRCCGTAPTSRVRQRPLADVPSGQRARRASARRGRNPPGGVVSAAHTGRDRCTRQAVAG